MSYRVDADKGFNFSTHDEAFVCQKKNHFQVTVHVVFSAFPEYIRSADNDVQNIDSFHLNFHGIKVIKEPKYVQNLFDDKSVWYTVCV